MKKLILAAAIALVAAPAADAAPWRQVTASGGNSIDQVGLVRTSDGVLHVAWHNGGDLLHTAIGANGRIGASSPIQSGWTGHMDAALTAVPGGIRAVWGAIRSTDSSDPNQDLNTALSTDGGASWQLTPGSIVPRGGQAYGSDAAATTLPNGTVLEAWAGTLGTWVHAGLDPATPNFNYQGALGIYGYQPGLASDAGGRAMMAWFSSGSAQRGVVAQGVNADGSPAGAAMTMPGSQVMVGGGTVSKTPIVARAGGGFYVGYAVGYPTANRVRVWRAGARSALQLARTDANSQVTLSADGKGRIWAVWSDGTFGETHVLAARSNPEATRFGAPVDAGAVRGAHSTYALDASATSSAIDILALFGTGTSSGGATYVKRIRPGLTLKARKLRGGRVTFTVTDAGEPVRRAIVRLAGRGGATDRSGRVTLAFARGRATAKAPGYAPANLRVK